MRGRVCAVVCAFACAAAARAGDRIAPAIGAAEGNRAFLVPFAAPKARFQSLLEVGAFAGGSVFTFGEVALRMAEGYRDGSRGGGWVEVEVRLARAPAGVGAATMGRTFAANVDATTAKVVFRRKRIVLPKIRGKGFGLRLPFDGGARFLHGGTTLGRSLVIEVRVFANAGGAFLSYPVDGVMRAGWVGALASPKACKTSSGRAPAQFASPATLFPGSTAHEFWGPTWVRAVPGVGVAGASAARWGRLALPLDLGPFGAPGCALGASAAVLLGAIATNDPTGELRFKLAFPDDVRLRGAVFYTQILVLDRGANALGLAATRVLRQRLGGRPRASVCSTLQGPAATAGTVLRQQSPVWRLR